jgi:LysR family glycine cleavage system transcriptional activator
MSQRLPPLNALRVFEVAARHLSFTRAAGELHVTQAAVSQQVKGLEAELGCALFRRAGRVLLLTDDGQELALAVREGLGRLAAGVERVRRRESAGPLTVTMMPSFAAKWLVPRLGQFLALHPEIELKVHTSNAVVDLRRGEADVAIRHGNGNYPGLAVSLLATEEVFPVCSPRLLEGPRALRTPADLRRHVLLRDQGVDWAPWLVAAGVEGADAARGPVFLDSHLALQAAIDGQGVALGRTLIVADDLAAGRLVRPFAVAAPFPHAYWFVCTPELARTPKVQAFRAWLLGLLGRRADAAA